ncbi:MAG: calcium/sodium antiporter [Candidatus Aminicenantes bacterium]|nr:calcium/sodium antiporter [Candidatus Aminicenantes bacterium]
MIWLYFFVLFLSFAVLFKCADFFVEGASGIANVLKIPKVVIGIVLVSLATTAPEFGVSVISSILGDPEIALGNAVGSVIFDDGVALALAAILAPAAIMVDCKLIRVVGLFLLSIDLLAYFLARNGVIGRLEGSLFVLILGLYFFFLLRFEREKHRRRKKHGFLEEKKHHLESHRELLKKPVMLFSAGLVGIFVSSLAVHWSATHISDHFNLSDTIIGLTLVALGTSLPEISTCITAALKGEGEIAVGDIIGADVLNILWIIGVSAIANPIRVQLRTIDFAFPFMILIVLVMLVSMLIRCRLTKIKGVILLLIYGFYLFLTVKFFM